MPLGYLKELTEYWQNGYDWRRWEDRLNEFPQFTTIDGQNIHFLHVCSSEPGALPLIISHGYPSSVVEFLSIIGPLTDPVSHGGVAADAFHVVAPSIPGFGFSAPVLETGWEMARTARAYAELMDRLGYERYGAQGGDVGAGIVGMLAGLDSGHVTAVHTNSDPLAVIGALDYLPEGAARFAGISEADRAAVERTKAISQAGSGYLKLQSNRPQTIAYSLTDSPVGQLAWIVENFKEWTDQAAELPEDAVDLDQLLANVSIYWFTGTGASAARFLYETAHSTEWGAPGTAPQGWALFAAQSFARAMMDPDHEIEHWSEFDRGGHFPAMEVPDLLVGDMREFFRSFR